MYTKITYTEINMLPKHHAWVTYSSLYLFFLLHGTAHASLTSSQYQITAPTFSSGGLQTTSSHFQINNSLLTTGSHIQSSNYILQHGLPLVQTVVLTSPSTSSTSSGGGGAGFLPQTNHPINGTASTEGKSSIVLLGRAYPSTEVTLLQDGQFAAQTIAGPDATFQIQLSTLLPGSYHFSLYTTDKQGQNSSAFGLPIQLTSGAMTMISGIFLAPTIDVNKTSVQRGDNIVFFGQGGPRSEVRITIHSTKIVNIRATTDKDGVYVYTYDTSPLETGAHTARSKSIKGNEASEFGKSVDFSILKNATPSKKPLCRKGDLNCDGKVNLADFSLATSWLKRPLTPSMHRIEKERLNGDGVIDLRDISIISYFWTK